ncbi:hypothetical protein DFJ73DRAFT_353747 [Zopfochytrium polystomum]|nr:hypothetical protein DFJ73DRAFT_353747 [Zopfochytrium polystomum]
MSPMHHASPPCACSCINVPSQGHDLPPCVTQDLGKLYGSGRAAFQHACSICFGAHPRLLFANGPKSDTSQLLQQLHLLTHLVVAAASRLGRRRHSPTASPPPSATDVGAVTQNATAAVSASAPRTSDFPTSYSPTSDSLTSDSPTNSATSTYDSEEGPVSLISTASQKASPPLASSSRSLNITFGDLESALPADIVETKEVMMAETKLDEKFTTQDLQLTSKIAETTDGTSIPTCSILKNSKSRDSEIHAHLAFLKSLEKKELHDFVAAILVSQFGQPCLADQHEKVFQLAHYVEKFFGHASLQMFGFVRRGENDPFIPGTPASIRVIVLSLLLSKKFFERKQRVSSDNIQLLKCKELAHGYFLPGPTEGREEMLLLALSSRLAAKMCGMDKFVFPEVTFPKWLKLGVADLREALAEISSIYGGTSINLWEYYEVLKELVTSFHPFQAALNELKERMQKSAQSSAPGKNDISSSASAADCSNVTSPPSESPKAAPAATTVEQQLRNLELVILNDDDNGVVTVQDDEEEAVVVDEYEDSVTLVDDEKDSIIVVEDDELLKDCWSTPLHSQCSSQQHRCSPGPQSPQLRETAFAQRRDYPQSSVPPRTLELFISGPAAQSSVPSVEATTKWKGKAPAREMENIAPVLPSAVNEIGYNMKAPSHHRSAIENSQDSLQYQFNQLTGTEDSPSINWRKSAISTSLFRFFLRREEAPGQFLEGTGSLEGKSPEMNKEDIPIRAASEQFKDSVEIFWH